MLVMQNVHKCGLLRQEADEELRRMETTVGEPTDNNRVRIFMFEKRIIYTLANTLESLL